MVKYLIYISFFVTLCSAFEHFEEYFDDFEDENDFFTENSRNKVPTIKYKWSYVNLTWPTEKLYKKAISSNKYIPENILIGGLRFFRDKIFISLPKYRPGVPVTLTYLSRHSKKSKNNLLTPFPSWNKNDETHCENLQNVLGFEIDSKGLMWVVDGVRINNLNTNCPPKLLLIDLNNGGKIIHTFKFQSEVALQNGGFLNDIVVDETDGDFAYITDSSNIDPGLVIYSRIQNRSWKLRDSTMYAEINVAGFFVDGSFIRTPLPVDGIALSPKSSFGVRKIYFTTVSGLNLYSVETGTVKDQDLANDGTWRYNVELIGSKQGHTDGMLMDANSSLYYTLIDLYGLGKWNSDEDFDSSEIIYRNRSTVIWSDTISMDQDGYLYFTASNAHRYIFPEFQLQLTPDIKFRIFQMYTGTKNYLY